MNFEFDDIEKSFQDVLRRYALETLAPEYGRWDRGEVVPRERVIELAELGVNGLLVPEKYGGVGGSYVLAGIAAEELARGDHNFTYFVQLCAIAADLISVHGNAELKQALLPGLASGETLIAFALTEPGAGSDAAALQTTARREGDFYILNGTKRYITNAPVADTFNVMAKTNPDIKGARGISSFIVEKGTPGISLGAIDKKMGQSGSLTCDVIFEDCAVPAENIIGEEGEGFITAMKVLDRGRLHISGVSVGVAERLIADALDYAIARKQFGKAIAEQQLIQAMLADSQTETYAAKCMTLETARKRDNGDNISTESSACKLFATEMVGRVADRAVQIHGGAGYMAEYAVERFYRDVRLFRLYEGTSQIQQIIIARNMIKGAS